MISKMLVPIAKDRIAIQHLMAFVGQSKSSPLYSEFPEPDVTWTQSAFEKISYEMNIPLDELCIKLHTNPLSSLGGIFNIRRHSHLLRQLNLSALPRHVSFRAVSTPPVAKGNLTTSDTSSVPIKSPLTNAPHGYNLRSNRLRYSDRRSPLPSDNSRIPIVASHNNNKESIMRPKPAPSPRLRPSAPRKPLERRCKTAPPHVETIGIFQNIQQLTSAKMFTARPPKIVDPLVKSPKALLGNALVNRRSVPIAKRYCSDRTTASMRQAVSVLERPKTTCFSSTNNDHQSSVRPCSVDCADTKSRRLSSGIPTHTAARAAARLAKVSCLADTDRSTGAYQINETRRAKLRAHVRNTIDTLSRSFSKFVYPSKRNKSSGEGGGETAETFGYTRRKTLGSGEAERIQATDSKKSNVSASRLKRSNGLAFWRRAKT